MTPHSRLSFLMRSNFIKLKSGQVFNWNRTCNLGVLHHTFMFAAHISECFIKTVSNKNLEFFK